MFENMVNGIIKTPETIVKENNLEQVDNTDEIINEPNDDDLIIFPEKKDADEFEESLLEIIDQYLENHLVNYDIVHQMSLASSPYSPGVSEFEKAGFTPLASDLIKPFRVAESPVQFECKVNEVVELGKEGGAGNLIICEVVKIHINEEVLDANGMIDQHKIDLVSRMGGNWYCRADQQSMFEIQKPITTCGIGFDALPADIKNSKILTGNDLGHLAGIEVLPDETEVNEYKLLELSDLFVSLEDNPTELERELHVKAQQLLKENKLEEAWLSLLSFNN
ncbi:MAG: flavin reductase family protein [Crocinitomicaceae bacterium]|nr:flavin reductase family protein [Crocinitomicaceae bacterium]